MKLRAWFVISLALNVVALLAAALRWLEPNAKTAFVGPSVVATADAVTRADTGVAGARIDEAGGASRSLGDVRDALRAAGVAPEIIQQVLSAALQKRRAREKRASSWWRGTPYGGDLQFADPVEMRNQREELRRLMGDRALPESAAGDADFFYLPEAKRGEVLRVLRDYVELTARFSSDGLRVKADQDRESLLREEMQRDLRKVLTEEEYLEHTLHDVGARDWIRLRMDAASLDLTEQEFRETARALLAARSITDEKVRLEEVERIHAELRERVGAERIFTARAKHSSDFYQLREAQVRFGFSDAATENVVAAWRRASQEAGLLRAREMNAENRNEAWRALAQQTQKEVVGALGAEAGAAYVEQSMYWLRDWERGEDTRMAGFMFRE